MKLFKALLIFVAVVCFAQVTAAEPILKKVYVASTVGAADISIYIASTVGAADVSIYFPSSASYADKKIYFTSEKNEADYVKWEQGHTLICDLVLDNKRQFCYLACHDKTMAY